MAVSTNPVRFGLNIRRPTFAEVKAQALAGEAAGFDTLTFSDRPPENNIEGWTLASAIGALTERVALAHSTLNVPLRNPALLAKMASGLDAITGGRALLILGAGAAEQHFTSYGIPVGPPAERFRALREAVTILRGVWTQPPFSYQGKVYHVEAAEAPPAPVNGVVPIWIGALGPQMLAYTGRVADGWLKNGGWPASTDQMRDLVAQLEAGAERAGRDGRAVRRCLNLAAAVADSPAEAERIRDNLDPRQFIGRAGVFGAADQVLNELGEMRVAGADTFHIQFPADIAHEQIARFGAEIMPKARTL